MTMHVTHIGIGDQAKQRACLPTAKEQRTEAQLNRDSGKRPAKAWRALAD
jgi:hypothetical protein